MEMHNLIDMLVGLILAGGAWWANGINREQKRNFKRVNSWQPYWQRTYQRLA